MGFKKMSRSLDFADFALSSSLEANRSIKLMEKIDAAINWSRVETVLMQHYTVGTSQEGAKAYPPILLFKCLLLQKMVSYPLRSRVGKPNQRQALLQEIPGPVLQ